MYDPHALLADWNRQPFPSGLKPPDMLVTKTVAKRRPGMTVERMAMEPSTRPYGRKGPGPPSASAAEALDVIRPVSALSVEP